MGIKMEIQIFLARSYMRGAHYLTAFRSIIISSDQPAKSRLGFSLHRPGSVDSPTRIFIKGLLRQRKIKKVVASPVGDARPDAEPRPFPSKDSSVIPGIRSLADEQRLNAIARQYLDQIYDDSGRPPVLGFTQCADCGEIIDLTLPLQSQHTCIPNLTEGEILS